MSLIYVLLRLTALCAIPDVRQLETSIALSLAVISARLSLSKALWMVFSKPKIIKLETNKLVNYWAESTFDLGQAVSSQAYLSMCRPSQTSTSAVRQTATTAT